MTRGASECWVFQRMSRAGSDRALHVCASLAISRAFVGQRLLALCCPAGRSSARNEMVWSVSSGIRKKGCMVGDKDVLRYNWTFKLEENDVVEGMAQLGQTKHYDHLE
jgi:hypothetical protein